MSRWAEEGRGERADVKDVVREPARGMHADLAEDSAPCGLVIIFYLFILYACRNGYRLGA